MEELIDIEHQFEFPIVFVSSPVLQLLALFWISRQYSVARSDTVWELIKHRYFVCRQKNTTMLMKTYN